jgi:hypothetical protein
MDMKIIIINTKILMSLLSVLKSKEFSIGLKRIKIIKDLLLKTIILLKMEVKIKPTNIMRHVSCI